jgi:hypothetical protein
VALAGTVVFTLSLIFFLFRITDVQSAEWAGGGVEAAGDGPMIS